MTSDARASVLWTGFACFVRFAKAQLLQPECGKPGKRRRSLSLRGKPLRRYCVRMIGAVEALYRYPVKGFTPEPVRGAVLEAGGYFPDDRLYAVENGPSGFDPSAPTFISKTRFTVLAQIADVAKVRTAYEDGVLTAERPGWGQVRADLRTEVGRIAFAAWLESVLDPEDVRGPLKVVQAPGHRFTDHPQGYVSVLNLASVAALGARMGVALDPLRFRANIHVENWPAWGEMDLQPGARLRLGGVEVELFKPIVRCVATHVDPQTGVRDADVVDALRTLEGHLFCGLYVRVAQGGHIAIGDGVEA